MFEVLRRACAGVGGFAAIAYLGAAAGGCFESRRADPCGAVPEGGCPVGRGGSCDDVACAALYDCVGGSWRPAADCARTVPSVDVVSVPRCSGLTIGVAEVAGCGPDLQHPDCPLAAAASCAPCATECRDFFACTVDGWAAVAFCDDTGQIHPEL